MSDDSALPEDGARTRVLSNGQVLAFIWAQWMRRPRLLTACAGLTLVGVGFDLALPWASGKLVDAVADPAHAAARAWGAWLVLISVFAAMRWCATASATCGPCSPRATWRR
ncbi:MAG: hypothetical protein WDM92_05240 [Caulobacteraceae bacterium]